MSDNQIVGATVIMHGYRTTDGQAGHRKQAFVLPIHGDMTVDGIMVFTDRMGHRAEMKPGGAIQIIPIFKA